MAKKFTGKNRLAAKFLGIPPEKFKDPGFCLGCGETNCVCDAPDDDDEEGIAMEDERCNQCGLDVERCTCASGFRPPGASW